MKPATLLRAAALITLLLCLGHTLGMPWTPDRTARGLALLAEMQAYRFNVMGFSRSYFDFYLGFGLSCSVSMLAFAVLLWQLATLAKTESAKARPMVAVLGLAFAGFTALDCLYFFTAPLVLTVPVLVCLVVVWLKLKPAPPVQA